jgi:hypothetical protein
MHRTHLVLTIAALAGFATAAQAADGAAPRSSVVLPHVAQSRSHVADALRAPHGQMMLAELVGKGEVGEPCHAYYGDRTIYRGTYDMDNGELVCKIGGDEIFCHPEQKDGKTLCEDGYKN